MKMKPIVLAGLVICLLFLAGCELTGTVVDTTTGEGIEGVRVSIVTTDGDASSGKSQALFSTVTNEDGEYRMSSFLVRSRSNKPLAVRFSKTGYAFEPEIIYVKLDDSNKGVANAEGMFLR